MRASMHTHTHTHTQSYMPLPTEVSALRTAKKKSGNEKRARESCYHRLAWGTACTCREWPPMPLRWCSNTPPLSGCRCVGLCTRLSRSLAGCACSSGSPSGGNRHSRCPCGNLTQQKAADVIFKAKTHMTDYLGQEGKLWCSMTNGRNNCLLIWMSSLLTPPQFGIHLSILSPPPKTHTHKALPFLTTSSKTNHIMQWVC